MFWCTRTRDRRQNYAAVLFDMVSEFAFSDPLQSSRFGQLDQQFVGIGGFFCLGGAVLVSQLVNRSDSVDNLLGKFLAFLAGTALG